jgi:16S rRNA G966 N2-methylase RsmD
MELIKWDKIRHQIETAKDIQELAGLRDRLRAYQILAEQSKQSQEVQAKIAVYKARADRKCGEWLKDNIRQGQRSDLSQDVISLKDVGISLNASSKLQKIANIPEEKFESILQEAEEETKKITDNMLVRIAKESEKKKRIDGEKLTKIHNTEIRKGDFKKVLDDLYNIDAIITDPPYPKEFIECFSELGEYAKERLKEDGFIAVYSGQYHLPEVIKRLSEHLTYVWTFCLYHVGKKQLVNGVNIMCGWKPVLIFSKGKKKMRFSAYDVLVSEEREKDSHEWQQSESGVRSLIEILTKPNELVVDPFAGSGTFLKVAKSLGRKSIGAEINDKTEK